MREIKFRAWDKHTQRMTPVVTLLDIANQKWGVSFDTTGSLDERYSIPMQYTGLKDKNGVEIYEGDILRYVSPEPQDDDKPDLYIVEWKEFGWEATWQHAHKPTYVSDGRLSLQGVDEDMEVIGNIYENPELLGDHDEREE